mmetsp:Transcript_9230/g.26618  ORF Transcript_9230/g.26618 Transcript_9230/m.26618 type:complete len:205 (-) Transcript_9230:980-1594(-)
MDTWRDEGHVEVVIRVEHPGSLMPLQHSPQLGPLPLSPRPIANEGRQCVHTHAQVVDEPLADVKIKRRPPEVVGDLLVHQHDGRLGIAAGGGGCCCVSEGGRGGEGGACAKNGLGDDVASLELVDESLPGLGVEQHRPQAAQQLGRQELLRRRGRRRVEEPGRVHLDFVHIDEGCPQAAGHLDAVARGEGAAGGRQTDRRGGKL